MVTNINFNHGNHGYGETRQDLELLKARQALTLQGAQQVLAILRGKKLNLGAWEAKER